MLELLVIRHGTSYGNEKGIIQGTGDDYNLTPKGVEEVEKLSEDPCLEGIEKIICSPLKRARETAEILSRKYSVPIEIDENLIESNPGILQGLNHSEAEERYSQLYKHVWLKRGDLDGIPEAEKGDELQARVLIFLERYMRTSEHKKELIVSHAGFNRYLINTALGRKRDTPIDVSHLTIHRLKDFHKNISISKLPLAKSSEIYKIRTADKYYILKIKSLDDQKSGFETKLLDEFNKKHSNVPKLIKCIKRTSGQKRLLQILEYIPGEHRYGKLEYKDMIKLTKEVYIINQLLKSYTHKFSSEVVNLHRLLETKTKELPDSSVKEMGKNLLKNKKLMNLLKDDKQILVNYDLHRSNILFNADKVYIIDLECITIAPEEFQLASFLMSSIQLEDIDSFDLESQMKYWPESFDKEDIALLMQVRAFIGASFFYRNNKNLEDQVLLDKYIQAFEKLKKYI